MSESPPWYDLNAFAAITGLGRTMVWQLRRDGKIRVVRVGRRVFVPASELARFVGSVEADAELTEDVVTAVPRGRVRLDEDSEALLEQRRRGAGP
jgi:hypothetical protein